MCSPNGFSRCIFDILSKTCFKHVRRIEFYQEQNFPEDLICLQGPEVCLAHLERTFGVGGVFCRAGMVFRDSDFFGMHFPTAFFGHWCFSVFFQDSAGNLQLFGVLISEHCFSRVLSFAVSSGVKFLFC